MIRGDEGKKIVAENRNAYHEFFILEKIECGIELSGTEVKSIRAGKMNIKDSYVKFPVVEVKEALAEKKTASQNNGENNASKKVNKKELALKKAENAQKKSKIKTFVPKVFSGECFLVGAHISPYEQGNIFNKDPLRDRKLLLHKAEIRKLHEKVTQDGLTVVPLEVYLVHGRVKVLVGLVKAKKLYDKRASDAERDTKRQIDRAMKGDY